MPNMIETEVMHDHGIPIRSCELGVDIACDVVVDFGEILLARETKNQCSAYAIFKGMRLSTEVGGGRTDRNEEAARTIGTLEDGVTREQLEPRIVAVEYETAAAGADLRKPRVLRRERGAGVALGEVEDEIEEGRHGAGGEGFDARHGHGGRCCVSRERDRSAGAYQAR